MILKNDKTNKNDDGHVIFIDKLTDHHIQNEKKSIKKETKRRKIFSSKKNK